jgi:hypothetical protein
MTDIRETVQTALTQAGNGQYMSYAGPVIAALQEREYAIADELVRYAEQQGLPREQARQGLGSSGLMIRPAAVQSASNGATGSLSESQTDELAKIRHDAAGLVERIDQVLG